MSTVTPFRQFAVLCIDSFKIVFRLFPNFFKDKEEFQIFWISFSAKLNSDLEK